MAAKRYRSRNAKPGELIMYYGKLPGDNPDVCYGWGGDGASKRDGALLHYMFAGKRQRQAISDEDKKASGGYPIVFDKSFLEELEVRGYDMTTLKFSIQKKAASTPE